VLEGEQWLNFEEVSTSRSISDFGRGSGILASAARTIRPGTSFAERTARRTTSYALAAIMAADGRRSLVSLGSATGQVVSEVALSEEVTHHVGDSAGVTQLYGPTPARPADKTEPSIMLKVMISIGSFLSAVIDRASCKWERNSVSLSRQRADAQVGGGTAIQHLGGGQHTSEPDRHSLIPAMSK
jgi:hypothetical protein